MNFLYKIFIPEFHKSRGCPRENPGIAESRHLFGNFQAPNPFIQMPSLGQTEKKRSGLERTLALQQRGKEEEDHLEAGSIKWARL
jgi:hypothetical protein